MLKKIGLIGALALAFGVLPVFADGVTVTVDGTYGSTPSTVVSASNESFVLTFTLPSTSIPLGMSAVPVTFSLNGGPTQTFSTSTETFSDTAGGGLFEVDTFPGPGSTEYDWALFGDGTGTFSGTTFNIVPGTYTINLADPNNNGSFIDLIDAMGNESFGDITGGMVTVASTSVPEPPAALLLFAGLIGLAVLGCKRRGSMNAA